MTQPQQGGGGGGGGGVLYGVFLEVALYSMYVTCGIAFLAHASLTAQVPRTWGSSCFRPYLVYVLIAILLASHHIAQVLKSYYLFQRNLPTQPTRRDIFLRVAVKVYIFVHGLILWVAPPSSCRHSVEATDGHLWRFYALTLWANCVSVILLPVVLSSSLKKARPDRQQQPLRGEVPLHYHHDMESQESISEVEAADSGRGGGGRSESIFNAYGFRGKAFSAWNVPAMFSSNSSAVTGDGFYDANDELRDQQEDSAPTRGMRGNMYS